MSDLAISDIPRRMGRPSLGVKATLVRLPHGVTERIDAIAGPNKRAIFIRDAVEAELQRREGSSPALSSSKAEQAPPTPEGRAQPPTSKAASPKRSKTAEARPNRLDKTAIGKRLRR